jgi:hypothetical protein
MSGLFAINELFFAELLDPHLNRNSALDTGQVSLVSTLMI